MTEITEHHVEWAVVNRLRDMLEVSPHLKFNVTHTYALFTTILCWIVQRIRTNKDGSADKLAKTVLRQLETQITGEPPWSIRTNPDLASLSADRFIIALRNATAHGDACKIKPFHRGVGYDYHHELVGFTFDCEETEGYGKNKHVIWSKTITLLEADLCRIGIALAEMFCESLRRSENNRDDNTFEQDAESGVIEKAA